MTTSQKRKILERIVLVEQDIDTLKKARNEVGINGYASATISTSGGSKSYTRLDLDKMTLLIKQLMKELEQLRNLLASGSATQLTTIPIVYS